MEQRQNVRNSVSIPVNYKFNGDIYREYTKDISTKGLYIVTHKRLPEGSVIDLSFSLPTLNHPLHVSGEIVRTNLFTYEKNICTPPGIAIKLNNLSPDLEKGMKKFIENPKMSPLPEFKIHFEPRFCYLHAADLSIGCENECMYCHFADINTIEYMKKEYTMFPCPVDITSLYTMNKFPSPIFLSPSSDPFSEQSKDLTHELLSYLLPKGIVFIILTKCIIPTNTLELIKQYNDQFEGIAIGFTNMNEERNKIIEPGCPSAQERVEVLKNVMETGVKNTRLRMDPLFPVIDDNDENLEEMVKIAKDIGVGGITATYLFTFGKYYKRLSKEPSLKKSMKRLTDKSPMQGGLALTLPLEEKVLTYKKLFSLCTANDLHFNTCGCKESRLRDIGSSLTCRNPDFYNKKEG